MDINNVNVDFLKKKKKHSQSFDNYYEYEMMKNPNFPSRKRRDTIERSFNVILEDTIDLCIKNDLGKVFQQPVKKKEYQDYYAIIKNPIDLGTMKNKTKRNEYLTVQDFNEDMELLVKNSVMYNGEGHQVTAKAMELKSIADKKIEE